MDTINIDNSLQNGANSKTNTNEKPSSLFDHNDCLDWIDNGDSYNSTNVKVQRNVENDYSDNTLLENSFRNIDNLDSIDNLIPPVNDTIIIPTSNDTLEESSKTTFSNDNSFNETAECNGTHDTENNAENTTNEQENTPVNESSHDQKDYETGVNETQCSLENVENTKGKKRVLAECSPDENDDRNNKVHISNDNTISNVSSLNNDSNPQSSNVQY